MRTTLRSYPNYRETGLPWIGRIPAHWQASRVKNLFRFIDERSQTGKELLLSMGRHRGLTPFSSISSRPIGSDNLIGFKITLPEDIVVNRMQACIGMFYRTPIMGIVSPDYEVIRPKIHIVASYYEQVFKLPRMQAKFRAESKGLGTGHAGFLRLYADRLAGVHVVTPPTDEQAGIVRFLNHADQKIRRFIQAKRRLIELLNEQKQLVSQRIFHRTNTLSPGKTSGISWLPSVPEHWSVIPLHRAAASLQTGPFGSQLHASDYVVGGRPIVNPSNMKNGRIVPDPAATVDEATAERLIQHVLQKHDIVFARRGEMGRCILVTDNEVGWLCGTGGLRMRPRPGIFDPYFLLAVLSTEGVAQYLRLKSVGTVMDNLNESILHTLILPLPPLDEQRAIVSQLKRAAADTDSAIQRTESEIGLIREYRTRLIADVVIGKFDVREAVKQLFSSAEQAALKDDSLDPNEADGLDDDPELFLVTDDGE